MHISGDSFMLELMDAQWHQIRKLILIIASEITLGGVTFFLFDYVLLMRNC